MSLKVCEYLDGQLSIIDYLLQKMALMARTVQTATVYPTVHAAFNIVSPHQIHRRQEHLSRYLLDLGQLSSEIHPAFCEEFRNSFQIPIVIYMEYVDNMLSV